MWKKKKRAQISLPNIDQHGWQADGSIDQITEPHPDDTYNLLLEKDDIKTDSEESDFYKVTKMIIRNVFMYKFFGENIRLRRAKSFYEHVTNIQDLKEPVLDFIFLKNYHGWIIDNNNYHNT